jgi:hydroxymethylglutaryl-CoA reductase (NADPH)
MSSKIPRSNENDYSAEIVTARQQFLEDKTGTKLKHTKAFSFNPETIEGNCEHLFGVAQLPIGVAGPLVVNGEHAQGEFYVPMATIEGTLIARYNLGLRVIRESGGVLC